MTETDCRAPAPSAEEIERLFRHPAVVVARPLIRGGIGALRVARRFGWEASGTTRLARTEPPVIFAANHVSHADTAAVLGTLPRRLRRRTATAAALDVFGPGSGPHRSIKRECLQLVVAAGFHAFAFDRHGSPMRSIRTATQLIRHGWSLLVYPEGTRSRDGTMGPFKAGVGVIARFTDVPVVPVHVHGGRQILPTGRFLPRAGRIVVRYGPPLRAERGESAEDFTARIQEHVEALGAKTADRLAAPARGDVRLPARAKHQSA